MYSSATTDVTTGIKKCRAYFTFSRDDALCMEVTTEQKQSLVTQGLSCELDFQIEVYRIAR